MDCPKCKNVKLRRKLKQSSFSSRRAPSPLTCAKCGGLWIETEEFSILSDSYIEDGNIGSNPDPSADGRTGLCPAGHGLLIRAKIDLDPPFHLEKCSVCGGIWFDKWEWNRIIEAHLIENLNDFWTFAWRIKHRRKKDREYYLNLNKELLGEELFESIIQMAQTLRDHPEKLKAMALLRYEMRVKEETFE